MPFTTRQLPEVGSSVPSRAVNDGTDSPAFDAVVFDLDGVVTRTAEVHAAAWKTMFDEFLRDRAIARGEAFRPFDRVYDYLAFVDGRPRFQGVESFLHSRGITLPTGSPEDAPGHGTIGALGNGKNAVFNRMVDEQGVGLYASTIALIGELRACGRHVGLATSSRNASLILNRTGITHLFGTVIDGVVSACLRLPGKPAPDIFLTACARLGASPARTIVVEDAVSGVQAGARGGFALTVGVARENNADQLRANGADLVVADLAEVSLEDLGRLVRERRAA